MSKLKIGYKPNGRPAYVHFTKKKHVLKSPIRIAMIKAQEEKFIAKINISYAQWRKEHTV